MAKATAQSRNAPVHRSQIQLIASLPTQADALAVAIFEKTTAVPPALKDLDAALGGALGRVIALGDFKAKAGAAITIPLEGKIKRLLVLGLGKREAADLDNLRWAAANVAKAAREAKLTDATLYVQADWPGDSASASTTIFQAIAEGLVLGDFVYDEFKKPSDNETAQPAVPARFAILESQRGQHAAAQSAIKIGTIVGAANNYTRRLSCQPANVINPTTLIAEARALATRTGLKLRIIGAAEAQRLGMGGLVAVGQGSPTPSALILLEHRPAAARGKKPIALVGKAVTFDTGGISIKAAADMDLMKYDKCGGMAVLGIMQAIAALRLPLPVIGAIPTAENAVAGNAYRPGDILRMFNGKTVEITNTDAEGRLILADALAFVSKTYTPAAIIDMATLTGGVVVALGSVYAGLMANDGALAAALERAGSAAGEWVWRLPLHERYKPLMEGAHADLVNAGGREAHPITGGIFLQHFVPEKTPWAHVDIAGVAFPKKDDRYLVKGATGFGVRLVLEYLRQLAADEANRF